MIQSLPARDMQDYQVDVGDTIMYVTMPHGDIKFQYAKIIGYKEIHVREYGGSRYAMVVEVMNKDPRYARRILRGPTFFKCGVELTIPTNTQIKEKGLL